MTPAQFKQARHELRLSTNQLGRIMNTNARTIRRWESGERQPNPVAARILEWLLAGFRPKEWPGKEAHLRKED